MLDSYTKGIRARYHTRDLLMSDECRSTLFGDFYQHAYGTDFIERLNSECTSKHPVRAPGRSSLNAQREHLLQQICTVHKCHGGLHPLRAGGLGGAEKEEIVIARPLLRDFVTRNARSGLELEAGEARRQLALEDGEAQPSGARPQSSAI
eukprot:3845119-Pyramimonas_sp.AAC.1